MLKIDIQELRVTDVKWFQSTTVLSVFIFFSTVGTTASSMATTISHVRAVRTATSTYSLTAGGVDL